MRYFKKNMSGYVHHALLGVLVIAIVSLVGVRVLTATHAQIPTEYASIGDTASITPSSDQTQTIDATNNICTLPIPEAPKNYPPDKKPTSEEELTSLNSEIAKKINAFRATQHVKDGEGNTVTPRPLKTGGYSGAELHAAAKQHTIEEGMYGYFGHNTPKKTPGHLNGWCWSKRIAHYYPKGSNTYYTTGENAGFGEPDITAASVMNLWRHSPEHLRNLRDPNWTHLGVSAIKVTDPVGEFGGGGWSTVTIITTDFGARH